jgi:hypothetical protein
MCTVKKDNSINSPAKNQNQARFNALILVKKIKRYLVLKK